MLHVGLMEHIKKEFWKIMDTIMQVVPIGEKLIVGGDLNGPIGRNNNNYERMQGGFGYGVRKEAGEKILDFATS